VGLGKTQHGRAAHRDKGDSHSFRRQLGSRKKRTSVGTSWWSERSHFGNMKGASEDAAELLPFIRSSPSVVDAIVAR